MVSPGGVHINETAGATVTYQVIEVKDLSDSSKDEFVTESTAPASPSPFAMDGSDAQFFRLTIRIDLP